VNNKFYIYAFSAIVRCDHKLTEILAKLQRQLSGGVAPFSEPVKLPCPQASTAQFVCRMCHLKKSWTLEHPIRNNGLADCAFPTSEASATNSLN